MGMFDKDKVFAPDGPIKDWIETGKDFILWDAEIRAEEFETELSARQIKAGSASKHPPMVHLKVSTLDAPTEIKVVSAIGDTIGNKVREKEDGDLPAIVRTEQVDSNYETQAFVLRFVAPYKAKAAEAEAAAGTELMPA